jgi:adenylosuccinate lyase
VSAHLVDSLVFGHIWATEEVRALFTDRGRTEAWLEILGSLALAQADVGVIPAAAAQAVSQSLDIDRVDLHDVAEVTRATGHSTQGLIATLQHALPEAAREWVYYGATVQDLTDTWTSTVVRRVHDICIRDIDALLALLVPLVEEHRRTVMVGRTHGQPGSLTTFGLKAAGWADELARTRERIVQSRPRVETVQLGGALGTLEFFGEQAVPLVDAFAARTSLHAPVLPWVNSRDRIAEFTANMGMLSATLGRLGNEIYQLQRPEIGEVSEGARGDTVGSITMPHKKNPERSEHLVTLAHLAASRSSTVLDGMIQEHERDGRAWKVEWVVVPEICLWVAKSLELAVELVGGIDVHADRMRDNIASQHGYVFSERVMQTLSERVGKHTAHHAVYEATMKGLADGLAFEEAVGRHPVITENLSTSALRLLADPAAPMPSVDQLIDRFLATVQGQRSPGRA